MSTPHNAANPGDVAKVVLMPGDPLRAKFIADTFLEDVKQFNTVRNMFGYTGTYHGKPISVMGSGMGMPSIGIYSYELYKFYGVETIIRIGSAGSYKKELPVRSTVLADSAWSTSSYARTQNGYDKDVTYPCAELNERLIQAAKDLNIPLVVGRINSSDVFYAEETSDGLQKALENNCVCAEMESFALFHNANVLGKKAACLVTISDCLADPSQDTTAEERQTSFTNMMKIALEMAE